MLYYAVPLAISGLLYCVWDLLLLHRHQETIGELFSFDERINLDWLRYVVYSYFVLFLLASFLVFGAIQFHLLPLDTAFAMVGIVLSLMLIAFGFYGFRQTAIFSDRDVNINNIKSVADKETPVAAYSKSGLSPEKIKSLARQLANFMENERPFLNENLSLPMLADQSKIPQSQISQVINQHFLMNFYEFVNHYRVEAAKNKMLSPDFNHLSILGIAFECGFKSKSSFNRYFKKYIGISPSQYLKK
ncbi:MAG: helix-turn-helix domain-containing protein, partial [Pricia sp.]